MVEYIDTVNSWMYWAAIHLTWRHITNAYIRLNWFESIESKRLTVIVGGFSYMSPLGSTWHGIKIYITHKHTHTPSDKGVNVVSLLWSRIDSVSSVVIILINIHQKQTAIFSKTKLTFVVCVSLLRIRRVKQRLMQKKKVLLLDSDKKKNHSNHTIQ